MSQKLDEHWCTRRGLKKLHLVCMTGGKTQGGALCGTAPSRRGSPWTKVGRDHSFSCCKVCIKRLETAPSSEIPAGAKASTLSFQMSISKEIIPLAWVPVADLEAVVGLLERFKPEDVLKVSHGIVTHTIEALNVYIKEALERNKDHDSTFMTWVKGGEDDE